MTTMDQVQGEVLQGRIDILILNAQIRVLVIEAKNSTFALSIALPRILTYMLFTPEQTPFGLVTNGKGFRFVKLEQNAQKIEFDLPILSTPPTPNSSKVAHIEQYHPSNY